MSIEIRSSLLVGQPGLRIYLFVLFYLGLLVAMSLVVNNLKIIRLGFSYTSVGITAQLNEFADKLIHNFGHLLAKKGFDPAQLPNQTYHFIWTFNLTEGWLQDLATIARLDDVIASYKSQTRTLNIALPLQFDTLVFSYKYDRHVALHHKGTVQGKINKVKIDCQLSYNYATYKVHLDKFDIRDSGRITVHFTGQGPIDWISEALVNSLSLFLHPIILNIIQLVIKKPIGHIVDGVNDAISNVFVP
ncbi:unnamed protein product [Acanthoscelides obtectus]|uniref:Uncharacterized protein n=1 Tax=Acanthoscelides obtectus TaxID=200917 RepID=A0A9P0M9D6_ACAOB|nr:unnamed protein product [Acanthoscelides obtectus]CAK1677280.1 hypothetical protein AOBTE_LOCUS31222 [Acanthoscelides obtectus]